MCDKNASLNNPKYKQAANKILIPIKETGKKDEPKKQKKKSPFKICNSVRNWWESLGDTDKPEEMRDEDFNTRQEEIRQAVELADDFETQLGQLGKKSLEEEIREKHKYFEYLLPLSASVLAGEVNERISEEKLMGKWRHSLEMGECNELLEELGKFYSAHSVDVTPGSLKEWMSFLEKKGIHEWAPNEEKVCVTCDNRAYYMNGYMFEDGMECVVEQSPWLFGEQVIVSGILQEKEQLL